MRLFVGVWLSEQMQQEVVNYINQVNKSCIGFKWTDRANLHFTLKFLGEVSEHQMDGLSQALRSAAVGLSRFKIELGAVGHFPNRGVPRIIWLGVTTGQEPLLRLADAIETCCQQQGFVREEKAFKPHLTIARAKTDIAVINLPQISSFSGITEVVGFDLIESRLLPKGPVYQTRETFCFED